MAGRRSGWFVNGGGPLYDKGTQDNRQFAKSLLMQLPCVDLFPIEGETKGMAPPTKVVAASFERMVGSGPVFAVENWADLVRSGMVTAARICRPVVLGRDKRWLSTRWSIDLTKGLEDDDVRARLTKTSR